MRHTDLYLKHTEPEDTDKVRQDVIAKRQAMDSMAVEANLFQALAETPGWKAMAKDLVAEEASILEAMKLADQTMTLKLCGSLIMVKKLQSWPIDRAQELLRAIEDAKAE